MKSPFHKGNCHRECWCVCIEVIVPSHDPVNQTGNLSLQTNLGRSYESLDLQSFSKCKLSLTTASAERSSVRFPWKAQQSLARRRSDYDLEDMSFRSLTYVSTRANPVL